MIHDDGSRSHPMMRASADDVSTIEAAWDQIENTLDGLLMDPDNLELFADAMGAITRYGHACALNGRALAWDDDESSRIRDGVFPMREMGQP